MEARQEGVAASAMPYVTIAPLMWGSETLFATTAQ